MFCGLTIPVCPLTRSFVPFMLKRRTKSRAESRGSRRLPSRRSPECGKKKYVCGDSGCWHRLRQHAHPRRRIKFGPLAVNQDFELTRDDGFDTKSRRLTVATDLRRQSGLTENK